MTEKNEAYMLQRDPKESMRLNGQHEFMRALSSNNLIHPSIPGNSLQAIADVGTGTGVWLQDTAHELLTSEKPSRNIEFVGFDVSPQQFPQNRNKGMDFVTHSITEPFPEQYREKFDLVHVRLLSYAIKAHDLLKAVENVVEILRPGGYLQWQECDAIDSWATPENSTARLMVKYVVSERIARELTPAIVTPLIRTIQSLSKPHIAGTLNPINWSDETMRITHLETLSTTGHPSIAVQHEKTSLIKNTAIQFLHAGASRRQARTDNAHTSASESKELVKDAEAMKDLARRLQEDAAGTETSWDLAMTWIVARKAVLFPEHEAWMSARHI